jgi:hypothetical protein
MYVIQFMIDGAGAASSFAKWTGSIKTLVDSHANSLDQGWARVLIFRVRGVQEEFSWRFRIEDDSILPRNVRMWQPIDTALDLKTRLAMYIWRNSEARSRNHCCCGKTVCFKYSVCVCLFVRSFVLALVIGHAKRMHHIILPSVACLKFQ